MTVRESIVNKAVELLEKEPSGIRFSVLAKRLESELPDIKPKNIPAVLVGLESYAHEHLYKPERGLFLHLNFKPGGEEPNTPSTEPVEKVKEEDFYQPFADWLTNEVEDVTLAIPLGGNKFKDKWGTPDVVGKRESRRSDIIKGTTEIVSAEIKTDTLQLITAFGQACAYKIFSNKVYLVVPCKSSNEDMDRLDSLCQIVGIGLVTFDAASPNSPDFRIKMRAERRDPDLFYTNKYMALLEKELFS